MKKRILVALAVSGVVFASVFGMAATLGVTTEELSAGSADLGPCDTDGIDISYEVAYVSTLPGYAVNQVDVTGVDDAACAGQTLAFTVVNSANAQIVSDTVAIAAGTTDYSFTAPTDFTVFSAQNAENIHAIIHTP